LAEKFLKTQVFKVTLFSSTFFEFRFLATFICIQKYDESMGNYYHNYIKSQHLDFTFFVKKRKIIYQK